MSTIPAPSEHSTRPVKVSVRVTRNSHGICEIKTKHPLPPIQDIVRYLDADSRNKLTRSGVYISSSTQLSYALECAKTIQAKAWSKAITKAIAELMSDRASVETELIATTGPAYMCMGNAIFELNAVDYRATSERALPALRRKVLADAKDQAEQIELEARERAAKIIQEAQANKNKIEQSLISHRQEIRRIRDEANQSLVIPEWFKDTSWPITWVKTYNMDSSSYVYHVVLGFPCTITIKSFHHHVQTPGNPNPTKRIWKVKRPVSIPCILYARVNLIDGTYCVEDTGLISGNSWTLPHISHQRACMKLGDAPPELKSRADFEKLAAGIARTMEEVNLGSLLTQPVQWHRDIVKRLPKPLKLWLAQNNNNFNAYANSRSLKNIECDETIVPTEQPLTLQPDEPVPLVPGEVEAYNEL